MFYNSNLGSANDRLWAKCGLWLVFYVDVDKHSFYTSKWLVRK